LQSKIEISVPFTFVAIAERFMLAQLNGCLLNRRRFSSSAFFSSARQRSPDEGQEWHQQLFHDDRRGEGEVPDVDEGQCAGECRVARGM
jgi:hypothetical protein